MITYHTPVVLRGNSIIRRNRTAINETVSGDFEYRINMIEKIKSKKE